MITNTAPLQISGEDLLDAFDDSPLPIDLDEVGEEPDIVPFDLDDGEEEVGKNTAVTLPPFRIEPTKGYEEELLTSTVAYVNEEEQWEPPHRVSVCSKDAAQRVSPLSQTQPFAPHRRHSDTMVYWQRSPATHSSYELGGDSSRASTPCDNEDSGSSYYEDDDTTTISSFESPAHTSIRENYRVSLKRFMYTMSLSEHSRGQVVHLRRVFRHVYWKREDKDDLLCGHPLRGGRSMQFQASRRSLKASLHRELEELEY